MWRGEKDVDLHGAIAVPHYHSDSKGHCGKERGENTITGVDCCGGRSCLYGGSTLVVQCTLFDIFLWV